MKQQLPTPPAIAFGNVCSAALHATWMPLGALAAGFGLMNAAAFAQPAPASNTPSATTTLPTVTVTAVTEDDKNSVRALTSSIGKGNQDLRDIPQSLTVVTERLMQDRKIDTLKEALHNTAGVTFVAGEGGEEDVRLRGFSLATTGDIFVDGIRDPAFYDRDTFNNDRIELLRGSASMLFGRGSTGGVVNQVNKQAGLLTQTEFTATAGSGNQLRLTADHNQRLSGDSALRVGTMLTSADYAGNGVHKFGLAANYRHDIGWSDEYALTLYHLDNDNGINYGLPWLAGRLTLVDPANYYGAASDYNRSTASSATFAHTHRFGDGGELKTVLRQGRYTRDQRASAIRFFTNAVPANGAIVVAPTLTTLSATTLLNRGTNNKVQDLATTYVQSDYSGKFKALGMRHEVLAGLDVAYEDFHNYALTLPSGVVLNKNVVRTTVGTPNDGASVDESQRQRQLQRAFTAKAAAVYAQDLVQLSPEWKLLGGLRLDNFGGHFSTPATATAAEVERSRRDSLWSQRAGVLFQPSEQTSLHFSYGTSFNTSGDTYQYDSQTANTPPESSQNLELGASLDSAGGGLTTRLAVFRATKQHERNRDPDSAATQNVLSGKRHSAGLEVDITGRLTKRWELYMSYAWTPVAKIDVGAPGAVAGVGEGPGTRPSLTPKHSGTVWTTYQLTNHWRAGLGLNARGEQTPNRNPVGVVAPGFATLDMLLEYKQGDLSYKFNVSNLGNRLYADSLYTAHYVAGAPRTVQFTVAASL